MDQPLQAEPNWLKNNHQTRKRTQTMGGGRRWLMANLNKRLMKESVYPLHEFFWDSNLLVSLNELIVPYSMRTRAQNLMEKYPELAHRSSSPKSTLLQLPNEILLEIYRHVDAILDAASLALVDGRLFAVSWQRLDELYRLQYGNWAGDQIICLGKSTKVDDLPKSVKAVWEEQAEWMERLEIEVGPDRGDPDELDDPLQQANNNHVDRDSSGSEDGDSSGSEDGVSSGYEDEDDGSDADSWSMESHITQVDDPEERKAPYRRIRWYYASPKGDDSLWDSRRRYDSKAFRELLQPETPKPHEQVLCNISKGQYVRADAIPKRDNSRYGRGAYTNDDKMDLSQALLSQIMWSSSPRETSIAYRIESDPVWRGKWAGDRIEVTTLDRLRPGIKWRDVSKKTVDRLAKMLRAESLARNRYQY